MPVAGDPRGRLLVALAFAALVTLTPAPSSAHSRLIRTEPVGGTTVAAGPLAVRLLFDEGVQARFAVVAVTGPSGTRVDRGRPEIAGTTIEQPVDRLGAAGSYLVAYRVLSADGHPVSGQFGFTFSPAKYSPTARPQAGSRPAAGSTRPAAAARSAGAGAAEGHLLHYVGSVVAIVVTLAIVAVERRRSRRRA